MLKILTVLNYLQTLPAFLLIPFILCGGYGPYVSLPQDNYGVIDYAGAIVPLVILAVGPTIYLSSRTFNSEITLSDVKSAKYRLTRFSVILLICIIIDCAITFLLCGTEAFVTFAFVSLFMFISFNINKVWIPRLSKTKIYYIGAPAWVIAMPFMFFILFVMVILNLPEKYNNLVLADLIICALMIFRIAMFESYQVIEENKQLIFTGNFQRARTVNFSQIKCVRKSKLYYIIEYENSSCNVLRISANIKKFKNTLKNNGIEII